MQPIKIIAIVLIVVGALGLAYGGFSFTRDTHDAKIGEIELSLKERETVNIPVWAGMGAVALGSLLLLVRAKD